jgi:hypothetical protein
VCPEGFKCFKPTFNILKVSSHPHENTLNILSARVNVAPTALNGHPLLSNDFLLRCCLLSPSSLLPSSEERRKERRKSRLKSLYLMLARMIIFPTGLCFSRNPCYVICQIAFQRFLTNNICTLTFHDVQGANKVLKLFVF